MWASEAPIQQTFALAPKVTPLLLETGVRHTVLDISWSTMLMSGMLVSMPPISSEGRNVFVVETLIWFYENDAGYFKHFPLLFGRSVFISGIFGRVGLGIILGYANRLRAY